MGTKHPHLFLLAAKSPDDVLPLITGAVAKDLGFCHNTFAKLGGRSEAGGICYISSVMPHQLGGIGEIIPMPR